MDINTKIEDDQILISTIFDKIKKGQFLRAFREKKIYTINDFINLDESEYPKETSKVYNAMKDIYRHEYLGEELINSEVLSKVYKRGYGSSQECIIDLENIGIVCGSRKHIKINPVFNYDNISVYTMEEVLRGNIDCTRQYDFIKNYYLRYLDKEKKNCKKEEQKEELNIKTKLEDDEVLKISLETKKFLNSIGIYTIEEFLNIKESDLPVTRNNVYLAMQYIYRNAYLNQELVYDVLLEKEYTLNNRGIKECSKDLDKLGLINKQAHGIATYGIEDYIKSHPEIKDSNTFNMRMIIENGVAYRYSNILDYYKNYYEVKKVEESTVDDKDNLINLKEQIQQLISQKDNLDQQIDVLQNRINEITGDKKTNGK